MIRLLDARIRFMGAFVIFLSMRLWMVSPDAISFNFFKVRTYKQNIKIGEHYVRQSYVDDAIVGTTLANIAFGQRLYHVDTTTRGIFDLFDRSRVLVNVDVIELLSRSQNPSEALGTHIRHTQQTLDAIQINVTNLREQAEGYLEESRVCLARKTEGDQRFFQGAQLLDEAETAQGLQASLDAAPCYITNRIQANATAYLADLVSSYATVLQRRSSLLTTNQALLIEHRSYFEGDILDQLYGLKQQLVTLNSVSYTQFNTIFNFGLVPNDYNLPTYDRVFFPQGLTPEFTPNPYTRGGFGMNTFVALFASTAAVSGESRSQRLCHQQELNTVQC